MLIIATASSDAYITDKIISSKFRAEDANTGRAGTLDLFKLYNETPLTGVNDLNEISRFFVKFDYSKLQSLTGSKLDLNSNFKATLVLKNIGTGFTTPSNFFIRVLPLSKSFDEGRGRDVGSFSDLDATNFLTSSVNGSNPTLWFASGSNAKGTLGASNIDAIVSGNLLNGQGTVDLTKTQLFVNGNEDLRIDVTNLVSASLAGIITNHGFRFSFSDVEENDSQTRFVKRFASRHVADVLLRPRIEVAFNDTIIDDRQNFYFDLSGSLFLTSYEKSKLANIVSGSSLTSITGTNCFNIDFVTGNYTFTTNATQHSAGTGKTFVTGVYSSSFAFPSNVTTLTDNTSSLAAHLATSGSVNFNVFWRSLDGTVGFHTSSLNVKKPQRAGSSFITRETAVKIINSQNTYSTNDIVRFQVFGRDVSAERFKPLKSSYHIPPVVYEFMYYRVLDSFSGKEIIPFETDVGGTRLSTDGKGMFFDFHMDVLPMGKTYEFEFMIVDRGQQYVIKDKQTKFSVVT